MWSRLTFDTKTLLKLWDRNLRFQNLCILSKISKIIITALKLNFFQISGIFSMCFGCLLLANTTEKKLVDSQRFYKAISLQYWQFQDNRLVTETCCLWDQDETWNLPDRDKDSQKWSRDQVSRLHHCK